MLSVVLPAYNEEKMIQKAAGTIGGILQKEAIDYEIIFVDDGSKDGTWQQIEQTQKEDQHVNGVRFSRNFGKESAMMAGLENAGGDCVVVMDCDLQHPPETIGHPPECQPDPQTSSSLQSSALFLRLFYTPVHP